MSKLRIDARPWQASLNVALIHLALSGAVILVIAALAFWVWFPTPYRDMLAGNRLFMLIACVDLALGPLLTLVAFDPRKLRRVLARDLCVIACLQFAALGYGVWTMFAARPVHLAFEVDLFRIVTQTQVDDESLRAAPDPLKVLPWGRPTLIGVIKPTGANLVEATLLGMTGVHLAHQPKYWLPFEAVRSQVWRRARPLDQLRLRNAAERQALSTALKAAAHPAATLRWVPVLSARSSWIALVSEVGEPVAFADIDSY
ncbi:hypothetical protein [Inhella proteolytica]|uniref:Pilus assembly protein n=1 Tax=Inhella proteolytica TaxID=2795029 RepID=A0A931NHM3_9BURK|nr:hypothetical protein [Inhella proteolytica]MBH9578386.1 hypothetical protein [Inhella proteolytica]